LGKVSELSALAFYTPGG